MRKAIFLGYLLGDYPHTSLADSGATEAVVWMERLNSDRSKQLKNLKLDVHLTFSAFDDDPCPLSPQSRNRLLTLTKHAVSQKPAGIILDSFRFRGHWESRYQRLPPHPDCQYCVGKNRGQEIFKISQSIKTLVPQDIQLGYYAVPFPSADISVLGQKHDQLGQVFDYISPMLYHRMINKPVSYISQFTRYLSDLTAKPILPIIAVKDMPDNLPDEMTQTVLRQEYQEACQPPSAGVAWFSWDAAVEKHKTGIIAKIWR